MSVARLPVRGPPSQWEPDIANLRTYLQAHNLKSCNLLDVLDSFPAATSVTFRDIPEYAPDATKLYLGRRKESANSDEAEADVWAYLDPADSELRIPILFHDEITLGDGEIRTFKRQARSLLRKAEGLCTPFCFLPHDPNATKTFGSHMREMLCAVVLYYFLAAGVSDAALRWKNFKAELERALKCINRNSAYRRWISGDEEMDDSQITLDADLPDGPYAANNGEEEFETEDKAEIDLLDDAFTIQSKGSTVVATHSAALEHLLRDLRSKGKLSELDAIPTTPVYIAPQSIYSEFGFRMLVGTWQPENQTLPSLPVWIYVREPHNGRNGSRALKIDVHDNAGKLEASLNFERLDDFTLMKPFSTLKRLNNSSAKYMSRKLSMLIRYYFLLAENEGLVADCGLLHNVGVTKNFSGACKDFARLSKKARASLGHAITARVAKAQTSDVEQTGINAHVQPTTSSQASPTPSVATEASTIRLEKLQLDEDELAQEVEMEVTYTHSDQDTITREPFSEPFSIETTSPPNVIPGKHDLGSPADSEAHTAIHDDHVMDWQVEEPEIIVSTEDTDLQATADASIIEPPAVDEEVTLYLDPSDNDFSAVTTPTPNLIEAQDTKELPEVDQIDPVNDSAAMSISSVSKSDQSGEDIMHESATADDKSSFKPRQDELKTVPEVEVESLDGCRKMVVTDDTEGSLFEDQHLRKRQRLEQPTNVADGGVVPPEIVESPCPELSSSENLRKGSVQGAFEMDAEMQREHQFEASDANVRLGVKSPEHSSNVAPAEPLHESPLAQQPKPQRPKIRLARKPGGPTVARKAIDYYAESHPVQVTKAAEFVPGESKALEESSRRSESPYAYEMENRQPLMVNGKRYKVYGNPWPDGTL